MNMKPLEVGSIEFEQNIKKVLKRRRTKSELVLMPAGRDENDNYIWEHHLYITYEGQYVVLTKEAFAEAHERLGYGKWARA